MSRSFNNKNKKLYKKLAEENNTKLEVRDLTDAQEVRPILCPLTNLSCIEYDLPACISCPLYVD